MKNQDLFQAMFEEATLGIIVVNAAGEIKKTNLLAEKLFGYQKVELLGQKVEMLLHDSFQKIHVNHRQNYYQHPTPRPMGDNLELFGQRKDGSQFPVEISLSFANTQNEKLAIAYINDITERKKAEDYTEAILSSIASHIAVINQDGEIINVNKAWEDFAKENTDGLVTGTGIGSNYLTICAQSIKNGDETAEASLKGIQSVLNGEQKEFYLDYPCHSPTENRWFSMRVRPLSHIDQGAIIVHVDITAQKEAEEELKKSLKQFETLTQLAPIGIFLTDNKGSCQFVNQKWQEITGISMQEALGSGWVNATHSEDKEIFMTAYKKAFDQGIGCNVEYRILNKQTDVVRDVSCIAAPILNGHDNVITFIGAINDITEIKKSKERLKKLNINLENEVKNRTKELEESQIQLQKSLEKEKELGVLKSRFVSMASHEFRTPLSTILSSSDLIENYLHTDQQEKRKRHTTRIKTAVKNLTNILNDFLSLEKLESGKLGCTPELLDFKEYMDSLMEEINLIAKGKQEIRFQHSGNSEVYIDPYLVKNVLINLLSNAFKYSPEDEHVELISKNENGLLQIKVKDRGIGIPKADHKNMFTRFFRATNVESIQGTGLGLTIVKRYLDLMGGEIDFESEQYKGTTFTVEIPCDPLH